MLWPKNFAGRPSIFLKLNAFVFKRIDIGP